MLIFYLRYRMQLWRNMAAQQQAGRAHAQQQSHASPSPSPLSSPSSSPSGLAGGLRPHFFTALLSGKAAVNAYPTPPSSPPLSTSTSSAQAAPTPTAQQAMLASMASQTLVGKLSSAFWDAFSAKPAGISTSTPGASVRPARQLDADKVRRVMEGSAVLKVVDVEPQEKAASRPAQPVLARSPPVSTTSSCDKMTHITDVLAESMATLSLGKK